MGIPTHINIGGAGYKMDFLPVVPDEALRVHGPHDSGWTTYGFFELDAFACADCKLLWAETRTTANQIKEGFK